VREAAVKAGRDPDDLGVGVYLTLAVADTAPEAAGQLDEYIKAYYGVPAEIMARQMAVHAGTLESAAEWFAAYRAAGARHLVGRVARPGLSDYDQIVHALLGAAQPQG